MPNASFTLERAYGGLDMVHAFVTIALPNTGPPLTRVPWAGIAIADPSTYEDGYKDARLLLIEDLVIALSDRAGSIQSTRASFEISDIPDPITGDTIVRKWLGAGQILRGADIEIKLITEAQRQLGYTPRMAFRGKVERYSGPSGFLAHFECVGLLGSKLGQAVVDDTIGRHFMEAPAEVRTWPLPLALGRLSDARSTTAAPVLAAEPAGGVDGLGTGGHGDLPGTPATAAAWTENAAAGEFAAGDVLRGFVVAYHSGLPANPAPFLETDLEITIGSSGSAVTMAWTGASGGATFYRAFLARVHDGVTYWSHYLQTTGTSVQFTRAAPWDAPPQTEFLEIPIEELVIGGGGSGGTGDRGGGGGAGRRKYRVSTIHAGSYPVVVGLGGVNSDGGASSFRDVTALGGGKGGDEGGELGHTGGSGGGGGGPNFGTTGGAATGGNVSGEGYEGGASGPDPGGGHEFDVGGGGGGGAGGNGGDGNSAEGGGGGPGTADTITESSVTRAVGGNGSVDTGSFGENGAPTKGNGGSGGGTPGIGGSGIVIISYVTGSMIGTGGSIGIPGARTIHILIESDTFVAAPYLSDGGVAIYNPAHYLDAWTAVMIDGETALSPTTSHFELPFARRPQRSVIAPVTDALAYYVYRQDAAVGVYTRRQSVPAAHLNGDGNPYFDALNGDAWEPVLGASLVRGKIPLIPIGPLDDTTGFQWPAVFAYAAHACDVSVPVTVYKRWLEDVQASDGWIAEAAAATVTPVRPIGTSTYQYLIVAKTASAHAAASPIGLTTTGVASLDGTDYNIVTWSLVDGATAYDVYRTFGPGTQGRIAADVVGPSLNDTGLSGDATAPPSDNTSGDAPIAAETIMAIEPSQYGVDVTAPGQSGHATLWGAEYYTDSLGHRWSIVGYRGADVASVLDGTIQLRANVLGAESVGDATGAVITSIYDQLALLADNLMLPETSLLGGDWATTPPTFSDGVSKRDINPWTRATTNAATVLPAGNIGARWLSEPATWASLLAEILRSGPMLGGINAEGQLQIVVPNAEQAPAASVSDQDEIIDGAFAYEDSDQGFANVQPYAYNPAYDVAGQAPELVEATPLEDTDSQDAHSERKVADLLELPWRSNAGQAQAVAQIALDAGSHLPRTVPMDSGIHWTTFKLGDVLATTHREGPADGGWTDRPLLILGQRISLGGLRVQATCIDLGAA